LTKKQHVNVNPETTAQETTLGLINLGMNGQNWHGMEVFSNTPIIPAFHGQN
jgi:hypothetical protein